MFAERKKEKNQTIYTTSTLHQRDPSLNILPWKNDGKHTCILAGTNGYCREPGCSPFGLWTLLVHEGCAGGCISHISGCWDKMAAQTKLNTSLYDPRFARDLSWEQSTQTGFPTKNRDVCLYMAFFLLFTDEYMHSTTINNDIIFIIKVLQLNVWSGKEV